MLGRWHGEPFRDYATKKWLITFEIDDTPAVFDSTKDKLLTIDVKQHRDKKTLSQNDYAWILCTKMAGVLRTSKDEVYEEMIQRYSDFDIFNDRYITASLRADVPVEMLGGHWKLVKRDGNTCHYAKLKGLSDMDTKEASILIDGIVSECKELGIETATPAELERMKQQWGIDTK